MPLRILQGSDRRRRKLFQPRRARMEITIQGSLTQDREFAGALEAVVPDRVAVYRGGHFECFLKVIWFGLTDI